MDIFKYLLFVNQFVNVYVMYVLEIFYYFFYIMLNDLLIILKIELMNEQFLYQGNDIVLYFILNIIQNESYHYFNNFNNIQCFYSFFHFQEQLYHYFNNYHNILCSYFFFNLLIYKGKYLLLLIIVLLKNQDIQIKEELMIFHRIIKFNYYILLLMLLYTQHLYESVNLDLR